jgi:hypothetical protein
MKEFELDTEEEAYEILAFTSQQGGTARACSGNYQFSYKEKIFKLSRIRNVFKEAIKDRYALRKFARTHATYIHDICLNTKCMQGNLSNKVLALSDDIIVTDTEKVWLSDFQADNEEAPTKLRNLIKKTFKVKKSRKIK